MNDGIRVIDEFLSSIEANVRWFGYVSAAMAGAPISSIIGGSTEPPDIKLKRRKSMANKSRSSGSSNKSTGSRSSSSRTNTGTSNLGPGAKSWITRRANAKKRSMAAVKAAATRARNRAMSS